MVTKNMNDSAFTISVTWHEIGGLLKKCGVKVTDETLEWAKKTLMEDCYLSGDTILPVDQFRHHCNMYTMGHPEHEA